MPFPPAKTIKARLWRQATAVTAVEPQSLPVYCFVASLNEMNNVHESRLTALRNQVPVVVVLMLIGSAMVAMGFTQWSVVSGQWSVVSGQWSVGSLHWQLTLGT